MLVSEPGHGTISVWHTDLAQICFSFLNKFGVQMPLGYWKNTSTPAVLPSIVNRNVMLKFLFWHDARGVIIDFSSTRKLTIVGCLKSDFKQLLVAWRPSPDLCWFSTGLGLKITCRSNRREYSRLTRRPFPLVSRQPPVEPPALARVQLELLMQELRFDDWEFIGSCSVSGTMS